MKTLQKLTLLLASTASMGSFAAEFSFDRPGTGFGTGITPVGRLAWEQSLPTASYNETVVDGAKARTVTLNGDMLLRTGLSPSLELQLGWDGPGWSKTSYQGRHHEDHGLGDVSIGLKKAVDLDDPKLAMAVLAQAKIATGNDGFTEEKDIYTLGSSLEYQYNDLLNTSMSMFYEVQDGKWAVTAVPTLSYQLTDKWSGFSEFVYRKQESNPYEYSLGSGVIYALNDRTQLDASIGFKLDGDDREYSAGLGIAYLF